MERNKFDLNIEITRIVDLVDSQQILNSEEKNELSDHLLDEIEELQLNQLSLEESLIIAEKRFTGEILLAEEFEKVFKVRKNIKLFHMIFFIAITGFSSYFLLDHIKPYMLLKFGLLGMDKSIIYLISPLIHFSWIAGYILICLMILNNTLRKSSYYILAFLPILLFLVNIFHKQFFPRLVVSEDKFELYKEINSIISKCYYLEGIGTLLLLGIVALFLSYLKDEKFKPFAKI